MLLYEDVEKVHYEDVEVGDDVRIKPAKYLDVVAPDGFTYSCYDMRKYCCQHSTVVSKFRSGSGFWVTLEIDNGEHGWSPWMFSIGEHPKVEFNTLFQ